MNEFGGERRGCDVGRSAWSTEVAELVAAWPEIGGVSTYRMRLLDSAAAERFEFRPGQFNMLYLPGFGESAISFSGPAGRGGEFLHTIRVAGVVTKRIAELTPGETLGVRGPFGASWPVADCEGRDVVLVAGGIGLAPLRPVVYHLLSHRERYGRCTLIYGARSPELLLYANEYAAWRAGGVEVWPTVDRTGPGWSGAVGVVTLLIDRLEPLDPERTTVLACGPDVMMSFAAQSARRRGVAPRDIWLSLERNMQCAVGLCGHCQLGPEFICRDGPVLRADRLEPWLRVSAL